MRAVAKRPGEPGKVITIDNDLKVLQEYVGGYIENFTFSTNACVICNEEGRIIGLPYNVTFLGHRFCGPILIVGVRVKSLRIARRRDLSWTRSTARCNAMARHAPFCIRKNPDCPCNTCARDSYMPHTDEASPCCTYKKHRRNCQSCAPCPDYIKEKSPIRRSSKRK